MIDAMDRLVEENFRSDLFVPAHVIDREAERRLDAVLHPRITLQANGSSIPSADGETTVKDSDLFI